MILPLFHPWNVPHTAQCTYSSLASIAWEHLFWMCWRETIFYVKSYGIFSTGSFFRSSLPIVGRRWKSLASSCITHLHCHICCFASLSFAHSFFNNEDACDYSASSVSFLVNTHKCLFFYSTISTRSSWRFLGFSNMSCCCSQKEKSRH